MINIKNVYTFLKKEILLTGHLMSIGSGLLASMFVLMVSPESKYNPLIALSIYLFVQPVYWMDRYIGIRKDSKGNPDRTKHTASYYEKIPYLSLGYILLFSFITLKYLNLTSFIFGLLSVVLGCFYASFFKNITKYIIGFKNYFVALFYVLFVVYAFLYSSIDITALPAILIFFFVFIRSFIMQIFLDLKDIESDKEEKLKTFPVVIGKVNAVMTMNTINLLSITPIMIGIILGIFPLYALILNLIIIVYEYNVKRYVEKQDISQFILVAAEYLILGILSIIGLLISLL